MEDEEEVESDEPIIVMRCTDERMIFLFGRLRAL